MSYRQIEKLLTCPFNSSHSILPHRMAKHLVSCQRSYPDKLYVRCCFNASHVVKNKEINSHILQCPDKAQVERDIFITMQNATPAVKALSHAIITPTPACEEDWDSELVETSYNAALNAIYLPVPRKIPVGLGKSAREAWRQKDVERVRLLQEGLRIEELMADELEALSVLERPAESEQNLAEPQILDEDEVLLLGGASGGKAFGDEPGKRKQNAGVLLKESAVLNMNPTAVCQDKEVAKTMEKSNESFPGSGNAAGQGKQKGKKKSKRKQGQSTDWQVVGQRNPPTNRKKEIEGVTEQIKDLRFNK